MAAIDTGLAQAYVMRKLHKEKMEKLEQAERGILAGTEKKGSMESESDSTSIHIIVLCLDTDQLRLTDSDIHAWE
ncbi:hypothetical protein DKX38_002457 [Salix brachista]|uniref:Uncharacterized protein n=1 Tax=Salix brachista TaxID=2182728 RepID=A0A5N5NM99_9ROSI|nr:hypothetical protein DKX38_002457 [Salix brachista]